MNCWKCCNNPCICGNLYEDWTVEELLDVIECLENVLLEKLKVKDKE